LGTAMWSVFNVVELFMALAAERTETETETVTETDYKIKLL